MDEGGWDESVDFKERTQGGRRVRQRRRRRGAESKPSGVVKVSRRS